nr:PASTA domain-containing protein [Pseudonocardia sp. ICBG601]
MPAGAVIRTDPPAGTRLASGAAVTLSPVAVPNPPRPRRPRRPPLSRAPPRCRS